MKKGQYRSDGAGVETLIITLKQASWVSLDGSESDSDSASLMLGETITPTLRYN